MKKKSLLSVIIPLILLIIGGFIFFLVTTQKQEIRSRAGVDMVDLTLSASPNPVAIGSTVTVNVLINTKTYKVSAVELAMTYDSSAFDPVSITPGSFLPTVLTAGAIQSGIATITLGSGTAPKTGTGTLAAIKLKRKSVASGIVKVDTKTNIAGLNTSNVPVSTNILGTAGSVTITSPSSGSPTPSSIISNTPTTVPSSSPTPSPLAISSPTPFSSPTPVPTGSGGFGGLLPPQLIDAKKVSPTPLSLVLVITPTVIPGSTVTEESPELTEENADLTPISSSPDTFDMSQTPDKKSTNSPFFILFGIASVVSIGGLLVYILQKRGIIRLPFIKHNQGEVVPTQTPSVQTPENTPESTSQPQPPIIQDGQNSQS